MTEPCQICGLNNPENAHYHKVHKMSQEIYFRKFWPRFDLQTKEPLTFKSSDQYLNDDFNCKNNLKAYLGSLDDNTAYNYIINLFKKRKELKNLVYVPGQFELRSILIPPITYILKRFPDKFNDLVREVDLINRFDYARKLEYLDKQLEIIQDTREQLGINFNRNKVKLEIKKLDFGDYSIKNNPYNVIFERKSLKDIVGTMSTNGYERFERELERVKMARAYLIIVIEAKYNDIQGFNFLSYMKHVKASPAYIMNKIRALSIKYAENCQFVAAGGRIGCRNLVEKVFSLENGINPINIDYQYMIDSKRIEI